MRNVAYIDDESMLANTLQARLSRQSIYLHYFRRAKDFFDSSRPGQFDLILVDLDMADSCGVAWKFAGLEVVNTIRNKFGKMARICVLTGNENPSLETASRKNGANALLTKHASVSDIEKGIVTAMAIEPALK